MSLVLITGANGQLGRSIQKIKNDFPEFNFLFTDVEDLDITNINEIESCFKETKPYGLINCAAYTAVDRAEEEKEKASLINEKAVYNLGQVCEKYNTYLLHISTDFVFDGQKRTPYLESDPANPISEYGKTKLAGEKTLIDNPFAMSIRTSWLYSAYGSNFVKTILKLSGERDELKIVDDQIGSPSYAPDLAMATLEIMKKIHNDEAKFVHGIYHYSNEGTISWYEFGKEIVRLSGNQCTVTPIPSKEFKSKAERPGYSVMDKTKITETYKLNLIDWKKSLKKCIFELKNEIS